MPSLIRLLLVLKFCMIWCLLQTQILTQYFLTLNLCYCSLEVRGHCQLIKVIQETLDLTETLLIYQTTPAAIARAMPASSVPLLQPTLTTTVIPGDHPQTGNPQPNHPTHTTYRAVQDQQRIRLPRTRASRVLGQPGAPPLPPSNTRLLGSRPHSYLTKHSRFSVN